MDAITLHVTLPKLPPVLKDPAGAVRDMLDASARAMSNALIRHFRAKNAKPNAKGWKRSNYWSRAADSVTHRVEGSTAIAEIRKEGVKLHLLGGTVRPRAGHKAVAIPADPSVAGIWPSEYSGKKGSVATFLVWKKGESSGFIAEKGSDPEHPRILWWLTGATHHKPDPTTLPENAQLEAAVTRACNSVLRALTRGAA